MVAEFDSVSRRPSSLHRKDSRYFLRSSRPFLRWQRSLHSYRPCCHLYRPRMYALLRRFCSSRNPTAKDEACWKGFRKSKWQWLFHTSDVRNDWYLLPGAIQARPNGIVASLPRMLPAGVAVVVAAVAVAATVVASRGLFDARLQL